MLTSALAVALRAGRVSGAVRQAQALPEVQANGCVYVVGSTYRNIKEHYLNVYAWSGAKGSVDEEYGVDHTMGVAFESDTKAGFSASGSRTISLNASASQDNIVNSTVWNRVNYQEYRYSCSLAIYRRPVSYYDMLSADWTYTGVHYQSHCTAKSPGLTVTMSTSKSATIGGGVSAWGASLSAQSGWNREQSLTYRFTAKSWFCGNSVNGPLQSSVVETHRR